MAPEQLEGRDADPRTDIFAFGAVLYEMLTGKKAFEGRSQANLIGAIMHARPAPIVASQPLTPTALERIVGTCLGKIRMLAGRVRAIYRASCGGSRRMRRSRIHPFDGTETTLDVGSRSPARIGCRRTPGLAILV